MTISLAAAVDFYDAQCEPALFRDVQGREFWYVQVGPWRIHASHAEGERWARERAARLSEHLKAVAEGSIDEGQRQLMLLALAELALRRPGFDYAISEIAKKLDGLDLYAGFKATSADIVHHEFPVGSGG